MSKVLITLWNGDPISDAQVLLQQANELWYRQDGSAPDPELTSKITALLEAAEAKVSEIRALLA